MQEEGRVGRDRERDKHKGREVEGWEILQVVFKKAMRHASSTYFDFEVSSAKKFSEVWLAVTI